MYYYRKIEEQIDSFLNKKEIILITGMRRTGKTTLLKHYFDNIPSENKVFIDMDNILDRDVFDERDFNNIWHNLSNFGLTQKEKAYIFVDEIQSFPEVVNAVKYLYDYYDVKFFVTGSSSFYIKNRFSESLSGRKIAFSLYPLDFEEFLLFKGITKKFHSSFAEKAKMKNKISYEKHFKLFDEYLIFGGFPQVVLADNGKYKSALIKDIFNSFFQKDVASLSDFKNYNKLKELIFLLMQRVGSKLDISKLSSQLGIARDTVYSYLNFLENTYFIDLIKPFSRNVDREVSGKRKVYIADNGFLKQFAGVSDGSMFENFVFNSIKKLGKINYYQKRSGSEIDFIVDLKYGIEVKHTTDNRDIARLIKLADSLDLKESFVVSKNYSELDNVIMCIDL